MTKVRILSTCLEHDNSEIIYPSSGLQREGFALAPSVLPHYQWQVEQPPDVLKRSYVTHDALRPGHTTLVNRRHAWNANSGLDGGTAIQEGMDEGIPEVGQRAQERIGIRDVHGCRQTARVGIFQVVTKG